MFVTMMKVLFLCFVVSAPLIGAFWSLKEPDHHKTKVVLKDHEKIIIKFDDQLSGGTKVSVTEPDEITPSGNRLFRKCRHTLANAFRTTENAVSDKTHEVLSDIGNFEKYGKDFVDNAVGKIGEPKETLSEKITETVISVGEIAKSAVKNTVGMVNMGDSSTVGTLKDSVVKIEDWDLVDSPKRIGEDIQSNASRKIEQGVEEVKETVDFIKDSTPNELVTHCKNKLCDAFFVSLETIKSAISWFHLFGFSIAFGMGVWVTFFSSCVLRKSLSKQQFGMVLNKINMVYSKGMSYCVGAALFGFLVSKGIKGVISNKMEMFQGFNLVCALVMSLINMIFFEPRTTKLIVERMNERGETKSEAAEKIKKLNTYSSTLNVSTMVVLTWHLAYLGQLLQARH
uniref:Putative late embryogenesis abundant domain-containing protein / LEA domain-containing protein n=1 Tax=Tanacetum cinerariifolium TaxID=118510 RepID=A0A6L2J4L3_TANCI|nr:putative late embryogenesis abundant domain-containing protein / LEA domain-containing protein [Tanacetum cinerariifolium]